MLKINQQQWFDLNKLGLILAIIMMILGLLFNIDYLYLILFELLIVSYLYYLYQRIQSNIDSTIIINQENQWYIQQADETVNVVLKDYWIHRGRIFIWLKGSKKSVSFVVSRSIIGAKMFSQLQTKII